MKLFAKFAKESKMNPSARLGFGCMGISSFYGEAMEEEAAMTLLKTVYDQGCRHFDTAEAYSHADPEKHNEKFLGRFFQTVPRDSYSVATKYFPGGDKAGDYETIKTHLQQSLDRLGLEYVDLYYSHRVPSLEYGKAFAEAAKKLQAEGLIKEIGLSEVSGAWLKEISRITKIDAVQQEWSLLTRSLEDELVPVCQELDVTIVAYSPLARNLLVQKLAAPPSDWRGTNPRYQAENFERNKQFATIVHDMADRMKCTPAQLCLAWLFHRASELGVSVVPIPGTTKVDRAVGNIASTEVVAFTADDLKVLDGMAKDVVGDRYDTGFMGNNMTIESQQGPTKA